MTRSTRRPHAITRAFSSACRRTPTRTGAKSGSCSVGPGVWADNAREEIQMSRAIRLVLNVFVAAGLATAASAQAPAPASLASRVDEIFSAFTPDGPGCAVAVYQNGKTILAKGYGSAN